MGNTQFFQDSTNLSKKFKWKEIFSGVLNKPTQEERDRLYASGCESFMPRHGQMLLQWTKPWLFFRFGIIGIVFSLLIIAALYMTNGQLIFYTLEVIIPPFVMPVTMLLFLWEMNIPRNISIFDLFKYVFIGGFFSLFFVFLILDNSFLGNTGVALATGISEELAKFIIVYIIIKNKNYKYILNGLLIGCAVGVGFATLESSMYALSSILSGDNVFMTNLIRGILAVGGHSAWAAMYGAALVAVKKERELEFSYIWNKTVLGMLGLTVLLHTIWDVRFVNIVVDELGNVYDTGLLYYLFHDNMNLYTNLATFVLSYQGVYVVLCVVAWLVLMSWIRRGIVQIVEQEQAARIRPVAFQNAQPQLASGVQMGNAGIAVVGLQGYYQGRQIGFDSNGHIVFGRDAQATVRYAPNTPGISGIHCEIKIKNGIPVLIDRESSHGTYFQDGRKLNPNQPYQIQNGMVFYLATKDNSFVIQM